MFTYYSGAGLDIRGREDVSRIFKENKNLGHESHYLLRPMRRLIVDRKPPGLVTRLGFSIDGKVVGNFGWPGQDLLLPRVSDRHGYDQAR